MNKTMLKAMQNHRTQKGFTLLEVLVVVAIVSVMVAVTLAYVGGSRSRELSRAGALKIEESLKEIQNNALVGRTINENYSCGFGVQKSSAITYKLVYAVKDSDAGCEDKVSYATVRMPEGTKIESFPEVFFANPHAAVYLDDSPVENTLEFQIQNSNGTESQYVCVDEKGKIRNNGPDPCL